MKTLIIMVKSHAHFPLMMRLCMMQFKNCLKLMTAAFIFIKVFYIRYKTKSIEKTHEIWKSLLVKSFLTFLESFFLKTMSDEFTVSSIILSNWRILQKKMAIKWMSWRQLITKCFKFNNSVKCYLTLLTAVFQSSYMSFT